jgi:endonuclease YncB( thermonuclease family)
VFSLLKRGKGEYGGQKEGKGSRKERDISARRREKAMWGARFVVLLRLARVLATLILGFASPWPLWAQANLENPQSGSFQSGIGLISGWVCSASQVSIVIDNAATVQAAYGTERGDTISVCGDANNGFGLLINWNLYDDGEHTVRALADGVEFGSATLIVTTLGVEFLQGASGEFTLSDFPQPGSSITIQWQESLQNFVIKGASISDSGSSTTEEIPTGIPSQFCSSVLYENNHTALVTQVIDGDTIELDGGERVRYIGIDTPEEGESGFEEATQRNAELVEGKTVTLDVCEEEPEDSFGRTLAYVIVDSTVVNEVLLVEGLAVPLFIPPCGSETAECYEQITPPPPPPPTNCDPSYPTVCIPPPPPDLDCGDIPYSNFPVVGSDPHGFDGDNDGIGCEQ